MNLLRSLLLLSAVLFCSSAREPSEGPVAHCHGCFASVTFNLPPWMDFFDPLDAGCASRMIDWTITRDLEIPGRCALVEPGSCLPSRRCLALGGAVGTVSFLGTTDTFVLSAGNNTCGGTVKDEVTLGDAGLCGSVTATITASCDECTI